MKDHGPSASPIPTENAAVAMPMLEKMARRMSWVGAKSPPGGSENDLWENWMDDDMRQSMMTVARAGLEVVLEPSPEAARLGMDGVKLRSPTATWRAMVQAILTGEA